jgi:hypothetical protein
VDGVDFRAVVLKIETNLLRSGLFSADGVLIKLLILGKASVEAAHAR